MQQFDCGYSKDEKYEPEIVLAWAVSLKNTLQHHSGHSLKELLFGFDIDTISILIDELPAREAVITSDRVRLNLNALNAATKSFI